MQRQIKDRTKVKQKAMGRKILLVNLSLLLIASILISACGKVPSAEVTPSNIETGEPTTSPTAEPTIEPTPEPTIDPAVLAETALNEELYGLMQIFDDGQGLVRSYDDTQMNQDQINELTEDQNKALYSERMIDQAYAVLSYIRIGKLEDARRILIAMKDILGGDAASYVSDFGGGRSIGWWNIAVQQYYLQDPDPELIDFMQWVDYKGYWRQPDYYSEAFGGQRITGEKPEFWENETNFETLVQTILYFKLDEKYGLASIYGVNVDGYNAEEQKNLINERFTKLADNLNKVLYISDENGMYFHEDYVLLDTYTNAVIMACLLEKDYPELFKMANVDFTGVLEQIETNYGISVEEGDKTYTLYKAANEEELLLSFESSLQVANAYLTAADTLDYRKAHPEQVQVYNDMNVTYVKEDDAKAAEYRQKAETIVADLWEITNLWNYPSFPLLEKNNTLYSRFGPFVFDLPAMSSLAQYIQYKKGSFIEPMQVTDTSTTQINTDAESSPAKTLGDYKSYKFYGNMNDPEFLVLRQELEVNGESYLIEFEIVEGKVEFQIYLKADNSRFK